MYHKKRNTKKIIKKPPPHPKEYHKYNSNKTPSISREPVKFSKRTNKIYRNILNTRNLLHLNHLDENDRNVVLKLLGMNSDFNELINRYQNFPLENIYYYLSGPRSFYFMKGSNQNDKLIYLIGEQHLMEQSCEMEMRHEPSYSYVYDNFDHKKYKLYTPEANRVLREQRGSYMVYSDIEDVLYDVYTTTPAFIDVFIESDFLYYKLKGKTYNYNGVIDRIVKKLSKVKYGRLHYIDIRGTTALKNDYNNYPPHLYMTIAMDVIGLEHIDINTRKENAKIFLDVYQKYFNTNIDYDTWKKNLFEITIDSDLLQKELHRSYIGDEIRDYFYKIMEENLEEDVYYICQSSYDDIIRYTKGLLKTKKGYYRDGGDVLNLVLQQLINISSPLLDMYTLARIFKKFSVPKHHETVEPKNVIIYAGDYHIQSMIKFLETVGYHKKLIGTGLCSNCVFTGMEEPFFL